MQSPEQTSKLFSTTFHHPMFAGHRGLVLLGTGSNPASRPQAPCGGGQGRSRGERVFTQCLLCGQHCAKCFQMPLILVRMEFVQLYPQSHTTGEKFPPKKGV